MGFLDSIGLGWLKAIIVILGWITLIALTVLLPIVSWGITIPGMVILAIITPILVIKADKKRYGTVPEGCKMVGGKLECKAPPK